MTMGAPEQGTCENEAEYMVPPARGSETRAIEFRSGNEQKLVYHGFELSTSKTDEMRARTDRVATVKAGEEAKAADDKQSGELAMQAAARRAVAMEKDRSAALNNAHEVQRNDFLGLVRKAFGEDAMAVVKGSLGAAEAASGGLQPTDRDLKEALLGLAQDSRTKDKVAQVLFNKINGVNVGR